MGLCPKGLEVIHKNVTCVNTQKWLLLLLKSRMQR